MEPIIAGLLATIVIGMFVIAMVLYQIRTHLLELIGVVRKLSDPPQAELDLRHGRYDDVIRRCLADIQESPTHSKARWYLARAYFGKQKWDEAKRELEIVGELEPAWRRDNTQPYLEEIERKRQLTDD